MRPKDWLTADEARRRMAYDPETGKLTWKVLRNTLRIGEEAKCLDTGGYVQINICGTMVKGHRMAWLIHYGVWPADHIDHINGDRSDNRISNLRCVSGTVNTQNKRNGSCKNNSGFLGVYFSKHMSAEKRYLAKIMKDGKQYHLGGFSTPEAAHAAYVLAKRDLHEGCTL